MLASFRVAIVSAIAVASVATASLAAAQASGAAPPLPPRPQPPASQPPAPPAPAPVAAPAPVPASAPVPAPGAVPPVTDQPAPPPTVTAPSGAPPPVYYPVPPQPPAPGYPPGPYAQSPGYPPPPPAPEPSRGAYSHDGFYVRLGLGIGRTAATFRNGDSQELSGSVEGSLASVAGAFELAIGGTPAPGLVIGGGIFSGGSSEIETSKLNVDGEAVAPVEYSQLTFTLFGPFIDYYFDQRSGFHLQGALGLAAMDVGTGKRGSTEVIDRSTLGGLGFMLGGGYEWFVGEQWSIGGIARMRYGALETDDDDDERWTFQTLAIPEILFNATFH